MSVLSDFTKWVPMVIMGLHLISAVICAFSQKWWDAGYWFGGFVLTFSIIFRR